MVFVLARFGGEEVERSRGARPIPANCVPEMKTVPLKLSDGSDVKDPTIVVFPSCTRVKRCGGCCNNNLVSCQAIESNIIVYEVGVHATLFFDETIKTLYFLLGV